MPKTKGGKGKKKRKVLQVSIAKSASKSPAKEKVGKLKEQASLSATETPPEQNAPEVRSRRTPKPRKIIDVVSPTPKARASKSIASSKGAAKKDKRSTAKKRGNSKGAGGKGTKSSTTSRAQQTRGKRKQPTKKAEKPSKQPKLEVTSDSGEDEQAVTAVRVQGHVKAKLPSRGAKRLQIEEEELQEELVPLPPESEEEEEEVDEEEDEVDDSLFFGLPPEKSLEEQDGLREPETYSCSHCREKFKKEDLPEHLSQCPDRYVQCRECGKVLSNLQTLERHHKRFHLKIREVPCTLCDKMFIDEAAARKHLKTVHFKVKNFHCPHCDKAFSQRNKLTYHVRTHSGEKPYSCTECGRSFSLLWNLKTHMRTHTGEKPYACDICGRQFTQKQNMTSHMTTHRKPKPDRRTFPGLSGTDLSGSSVSYTYEGSGRSGSSSVKTQGSGAKPYSLSNVLKNNYISSSKPVLQGIGQHYLLDDVASVVDIPGRPDTSGKITSQAGLGAAAAQINQNLLSQQLLSQQGQNQSVETGLGLLSAVARKGDDSNVQVDGIVSLDQGQHSGTGNPSLDQVVEVFLQSNAGETSADSFIPSMVGAETMVSTSEMEHDSTAVGEGGDHAALLSGDQISGEKVGDSEGSQNKQMVGQITAQTVIPVDQANLAGLANILQNPEILAAINAASSSNKFIVIGPVGMFSGQQTGTTNSSTVSDATIGETITTDLKSVTTSSTGEIPSGGGLSKEEVSTVAATEGHIKPALISENLSSLESNDLVPKSADDGQGVLAHNTSSDIDHEYGQSEVAQAGQVSEVSDASFIPASSSENVIQISSSFSKAIAGMSSRITANNISDVTAALMNEIQGQIQSQGGKGAKTDDDQPVGDGSMPVVTEGNEAVVGEEADATGENKPIGFNPVETNPLGEITKGEEMLAGVPTQQNVLVSESNQQINIAVSINESHASNSVTESSEVVYAPGTAEELTYNAVIDANTTTSLRQADTTQTEQFVGTDSAAQALNSGLTHESSVTAADTNTVYLSQLPTMPSEQVSAGGLVADAITANAEGSDATVVVNPSIVQSLLNNINLPGKSVDDNGDFPVIDIATGDYIGTSSMLNSVPVSSNRLEVTIGSEQLSNASGVCLPEGMTIQTTSQTLSEEQDGQTPQDFANKNQPTQESAEC